MTRKKSLEENYFGHEQEEAIRLFIKSKSSKERNDIYNQSLKEPMNKMVESIIRKYKLYRKSYTFEEIHADALSFMIMKSDMFQIDKNKKAYSYFGTICKNYMLTLIDKDNKLIKRNLHYEDIHLNIEENEDYSYTITEENVNYKKLFDNIIKRVNLVIDEKKVILIEGRLKNIKKIENDIKIGYALIFIFEEKRDLILDELGRTRKYNRHFISDLIKNFTGLTTKEIRDSLKTYKLGFFEEKKIMIENDEI